MHLSVGAEFDSEHFQSSMQKLGISTEEEFFSETSIGLFSSSKTKSRELDQEICLGETPGNSKPSLSPSWKNPKILKMISFGTFSISRDWRRIRS